MPDRRTRSAVVEDYRAARMAADHTAMARLRNEEACLVLLSTLESLARDESTFIHHVALKGGILMAGELRSPRVSADIDATAGHGRRIDVESAGLEIVRAGRAFRMRIDGEPERTTGGHIIHLRFESLTDGGTAKLEVSIREDLVFAVRDAVIDLSGIGLSVFSVPAVAKVELVAEKLRALAQRAQPRDLFDLHLYLVDSGWHLDRRELRQAVDRKLELTRFRRWAESLWRTNLDEIERTWEPTLLAWVAPEDLPTFDQTVSEVDRRLRALGL